MFYSISDLFLIDGSRLYIEIMKNANEEAEITVITGCAVVHESTCRRKLAKHV